MKEINSAKETARILDDGNRLYISCHVDFPATTEGKILTATIEYLNELRKLTREASKNERNGSNIDYKTSEC